MKNIVYKINYLIVVLLLLLLSSCNSEGNYKGEAVGKTANFDSIINVSKSKPLANVYYNHGNFINSKEFPPIVNSTDVYQHINNWLLIDIRDYKSYEKGHIRGSYNVYKYRLIDYLTEIRNADAFEKVVIIDSDGQLASYITGVLRYAGFDNVYTMYYGMAAWNSKLSQPLKNGYQKGFNDFILRTTPKKETINHNEEVHPEKNKSIDELIKKIPQLSDSLPSLLIEQRARKMLKVTPTNYLVSAEVFFKNYKSNPNQYLPVFYMDNKKKFEESHIKGAELYKSRKDLSLDTKLTELPKDKQIVLYCQTGHTSSTAAAYLNMLGYKAYSLNFGFNSYDGDKNELENIINNYPIVLGKRPFGEKAKK
ncbi:MAG TPA: hypothetical protein EYG89_01715 [Bacteroidia bacterium]|nr:hypothetical protein [Bacteroidia bacterium]